GVAAMLAIGFRADGPFFAADAVVGTAGAQAGNSKQIVDNLRLAGTLLTAAAIMIIVGALGRYWAFHETGAILLLVGLGLLIGMPFLVGSFASTYPAKSAATSNDLFSWQFVLTGGLLTAAGGIQLLIRVILDFVIGSICVQCIW